MGKRSGISQLTVAFWRRYPHVLACPEAQAWVEHLCAIQAADKTITAYALDVERFIAFCISIGRSHLDGRISTIDKHFNAMDTAGNVIRIDSGRPLARATMVRRVAAIRNFFDFLVADGRILQNPIVSQKAFRKRHGQWKRGRGRAYMRRPKTLPWIPNETEFQRLLLFLRNPLLCGERDRFMFYLQYMFALRTEELVSLCVEQFDFENMLLSIRDGKGGKPAVLPFLDDLSAVWPNYIRFRANVRTGGGPLFFSLSNRNYGHGLSTGSWSDRVAEIRDAVGLPKFHPHTLRHLRLTDLARAGMDPLPLKAFARHEEFRTTQTYFHLSANDVVKAYKTSDFHVGLARARLLLEVDGKGGAHVG